MGGHSHSYSRGPMWAAVVLVGLLVANAGRSADREPWGWTVDGKCKPGLSQVDGFCVTPDRAAKWRRADADWKPRFGLALHGCSITAGGGRLHDIPGAQYDCVVDCPGGGTLNLDGAPATSPFRFEQLRKWCAEARAAEAAEGSIR